MFSSGIWSPTSLLVLLAFLAMSPQAPAATGEWEFATLGPGVTVEARLIAAVEATGDLETVPAGLQVRLPDGWKSYWRSPGDAGLPPALDFSSSANLAALDLRYPAPHRFTLFGLDTFGYDEGVVYPLTLTPENAGAPIQLRGRADLLVCSETLCIPAGFDLALDLPSGPAAADTEAGNLIARYTALIPVSEAVGGVSFDAAWPTQDGEALHIEASSRELLEAPDIFVEAGDGWTFGAPALAFTEEGAGLRAEMPVLQRPEGEDLAGRALTVTLVDGDLAVEGALTAGAAGMASAGGANGGLATAAPAPAGTGLLAALGLALLGGLILNLMPCVLPVLSIKLMGVLSAGGRAPGAIRAGFLATAAGILASFMVLAAGLIAVKVAGGAVGWGIQFQQPIFLAFMIVLLTLFAANLAGLFEISLPGAAGDRILHATRGQGLAGHFATGAFATLLATPCSAPFLGAAVGFALARGSLEILAIFAALGVGLALPYLAVAAFPRAVGWLPRPGRWMLWLKGVLALALLATALWLLAVMAAQISPAAALVIGLLMVGILLALWGRRVLGRTGWGLAIVLAAAALILPAQLPQASDRPGAGDAAWTSFDPVGIDRAVAEGQVVLVDVTADWCLTCRANKMLVLDRGLVAEALGDSSVTAMRADWTRPDPSISNYLASWGRYGIPFNVVYGPDAPDGLPLPELLSEEAVMAALREAGLDS